MDMSYQHPAPQAKNHGPNMRSDKGKAPNRPQQSASSAPQESAQSTSGPSSASASDSAQSWWHAPQSLENPTAPRTPANPQFLHRDGPAREDSKVAETGSAAAGAVSREEEARRARLAQQRQATYFRRVTGSAAPTGSAAVPTASVSASGPRPGMISRWSTIGTFVLSVGLGGWMVLWCDFGDREHVFSPLRRMIFASSSRISSEEQVWLQRGSTAATSPASDSGPAGPRPDEAERPRLR
ncbi:hypothetical protein OC845_005225 [Tilletia horrida]|nr:hypothetical protein OC845_005225 [Tilletia horrida]